jgi:hypothetical protein
MGCSAYDAGNEILVENPLESARTTQDLLDARENVEKSLREYENCLKKNPDDTSKCEARRKSYQKNGEEYNTLQSE